MCPIAWSLPDRVQAIPLPTVDGSSQGAVHNWPSAAPGGGRVRSARVSSAHRTPATPVVWPGACGLARKLPRAAWSSDAVALRWLHAKKLPKSEPQGSSGGPPSQVRGGVDLNEQSQPSRSQCCGN
ncbi:UNVERIFIED_CONTAM: hypothetical protein FKN15_033710 [Acipenser sinensis]